MNPLIHIGYEDEHILVVWKSHGLLTSGNSRKTLRLFVRKMTGLKHIEPCHRLDFATAGWVVFGKTAHAIRAVNELFHFGEVHKLYWAICHGTLSGRISINLPIEGKPSATTIYPKAFGTLAQSSALTAAVIQTHTGRTHQIRRHLQAVGHNVVGDDKYPNAQGIYTGRGLFLCAHELAFSHPLTGEAVEINSLPSKKFKTIPWVHKVLNQRILPLSSSE
tara:strand:- start:1925 stop:2584 length:660 start_codon:yes stop_codon:yes gene_type:complete